MAPLTCCNLLDGNLKQQVGWTSFAACSNLDGSGSPKGPLEASARERTSLYSAAKNAHEDEDLHTQVIHPPTYPDIKQLSLFEGECWGSWAQHRIAPSRAWKKEQLRPEVKTTYT